VLYVDLDRAGLTNVGTLFGKMCGAYSQNQNERPNDRVLFNCCQLLKIENARRPDKDRPTHDKLVYTVVHTFDWFVLRCFLYFY